MRKLKPAGSEWLKQKFDLSNYVLTHSSYIGYNNSIELMNKGNVEQVYGLTYAPVTDSILEHLEFSLNYDDLHLDFLKEILLPF